MSINIVLSLDIFIKQIYKKDFKILVLGHKHLGHKCLGHKKVVTNVRVTNVLVINVLATNVQQPDRKNYIYINPRPYPSHCCYDAEASTLAFPQQKVPQIK